MIDALRVRDLLEALQREDPDARVSVSLTCFDYEADELAQRYREDALLLSIRRERGMRPRVVLEGE